MPAEKIAVELRVWQIQKRREPGDFGSGEIRGCSIEEPRQNRVELAHAASTAPAQSRELDWIGAAHLQIRAVT